MFGARGWVLSEFLDGGLQRSRGLEDGSRLLQQ